jgi:phage baseplate assembly protein W
MATFIGYSSVDRKFGNFTLKDVELAKRDLLNHFYTRKGERLGEPEFGSIIQDMVFEPLDDRTVNAVEDDVRDVVANDPRWILNTLNITTGQHTIECILNLIYKPDSTAEELYLKFTAEEEEEDGTER